MSPSYIELLGIDVEAIGFEWNNFPGFSSLQILQEIQNDLRNIESEKFTDRIIFMSMFNDIDWTRKGHDGMCTSNFEEVKEHAKRFSQHWTFLGPGDEMKWNGTLLFLHLKGNGTLSHPNGGAIHRYQSSSIQEYQCFESWDGSWKRKITETPYTSMRLLFQIIDSVNQLSIYGTVSNWCKQFGLAEEERGKERPLARKESVTKGVLSSVNSKEVKNCIFSKTSIWKQFAEKTFKTSNPCLRQCDLERYAKTQFLRIEFQLV